MENINCYTKDLNNVYKSIILPILDDKFELEFIGNKEYNHDSLVSCSYDNYLLIKNNNLRVSHEKDCCAYLPVEVNSTEHPVINNCIPGLLSTLKANTGYNDLALSSKPIIYKKNKNISGYMGWHTNFDYPGDRWYFVYNLNEDSSFFRYVDPVCNKMVTINEPKGWSLNHFVIGDKQSPLWHCIHTKSIRISIGIRRHPILNEFSFKSMVLR